MPRKIVLTAVLLAVVLWAAYLLNWEQDCERDGGRPVRTRFDFDCLLRQGHHMPNERLRDFSRDSAGHG